MKRWTWSLALAVLLGGTFSFTYADYIIIVANLGLSKDKPGDGGKPGTGGPFPPGGATGAAGAMGAGGGVIGAGAGAAGAAGAIGAGGGNIGRPPGGAIGVGGAAGAGGGAIGVGGGAAGAAGARGGPFPPGTGAIGVGGGAIGVGGGPIPPGAGNFGKGGGPGMMGMMGGPPGGAMGRGMYGMMGGGDGFLPGGPGSGGKGDAAALYVRAVIEVDVSKKDTLSILLGKKGWVTTKWGQTCLMDSTPDLQTHLIRLDKISKVFDKKKHELDKDPKPSVQALIDLASWALRHGLLKQFEDTMKKAEEVDPQNATVADYKKIDAELKKEVKGRDLSSEWKRKVLDSYAVRTSDHYALLYGPASTETDVRSRLAHLEANFKMFYYWFALQRKVLPVPQDRLVAVLVPDKEEFDRQQKIFETSADVADGFFVARDNLAVYSQVRLDAPYLALRARCEGLWQAFDRDQMLKGKTKVKAEDGSRPSDDQLARAMTVALLEKALEEDAELASVSHEGTRQLIAAAGLTSPGVIVPDWIQFGIGSFFETPKGAPWTSMGEGHWDYLPLFKTVVKETDFKAVDALKATITDRYFRQTAKDQKKEKIKEDLTGKTEQVPVESKARALAWSLTYYLAQDNLDGLLRYYKELSKLPRDIEFDEEVLLGCFARAFDLLDPATKAIDQGKLGRLADKWQRFVTNTPSEAEEVLKELKKNKEESKQPPKEEGKGPGVPPGRPIGPQ
jgi:hypothetical protein